MIQKITEQEKNLLLEKKIEKIDKDTKYAKELFETYFDDPFQENIDAWQAMDNKAKAKLVKKIIKFEDKAMVNEAFAVNKTNPKAALSYLNNLKVTQLKHFGVRK